MVFGQTDFPNSDSNNFRNFQRKNSKKEQLIIKFLIKNQKEIVKNNKNQIVLIKIFQNKKNNFG